MKLMDINLEIMECRKCSLEKIRNHVIVGEDQRITRVRGQWLSWSGRPTMPVFHPSALLRNPELKRPTWEDYKKIVFKYRELVNSSHYSAHI